MTFNLELAKQAIKLREDPNYVIPISTNAYKEAIAEIERLRSTLLEKEIRIVSIIETLRGNHLSKQEIQEIAIQNLKEEGLL